MTPQDTMRLALELLDRQWQCSAPWSLEEAQDVAEALREALAQPEPPPPPPECQTEAEKTAYAFGWWKALETVNRTALAQQGEQQPVAYYDFQERGFYWERNTSFDNPPVSVKVAPLPLYAGAAPAAQTLSHEQIKEMWIVHRAALPRYLCFAKAIERHHGIGVQK